MGNTEVAVYHPAVISDGFFVLSILIVDEHLAVFVFFSLLDGPLFTEELDPVFKGNTRNALKTFNKFKLVELVGQGIYFFKKVLFSQSFVSEIIGGPEHNPVRFKIAFQ